MSDASLTEAIQSRADPDARVERFEHRGSHYWVKRRERLGLRMRLQKGSAGSAFQVERDAYKELRAAGLPVPDIAAEGADFFAIPDCGLTLSSITKGALLPFEERIAAYEAAARGLWKFHEAGVSHGRPSLKDICWDGHTVRFIDFERYSAVRNTAQGHADDLVMLVFNALSLTGARTPEIDAFIAEYRRNAPARIWQLAAARCHRFRWLGWLCRPLMLRRDGKSKEFKAIPLTLACFKEP